MKGWFVSKFESGESVEGGEGGEGGKSGEEPDANANEKPVTYTPEEKKEREELAEWMDEFYKKEAERNKKKEKEEKEENLRKKAFT